MRISLSQEHLPRTNVLLINMPFGMLAEPSIGLGLLQAHLKPSGISSKVLNFTLNFADSIGISLYNRITNREPAISDLLGEWLFSAVLFPDSPYT